MSRDRYMLPADQMTPEDIATLEKVHAAGCAVFTDCIPKLFSAVMPMDNQTLRLKVWSAFFNSAMGAMEADMGHANVLAMLAQMAQQSPVEPAPHSHEVH